MPLVMGMGKEVLPPSPQTSNMRFEDFNILCEVARNVTGSVYKAKHSRSGMQVILKSRTSAEIGKEGNMMHEVQLLQSVDHPNIIKCFGSFWKHGVFYMVLELADRGDLSKIIAEKQKKREPFEEQEIFGIFIPLMRVAAHLHERGIIHRDLKALNVFLARDGTVKVGDFGVGRQLSDQTVMVDTMHGTPLYLSPELCENRPYDQKTDIWSLGVLLYEMCTLHPPFKGRNLVELARNIVGGIYSPISDRFSQVMHKSIKALLQRDQKKRPSAREYLDWYAKASGIVRSSSARDVRHGMDGVQPAKEPSSESRTSDQDAARVVAQPASVEAGRRADQGEEVREEKDGRENKEEGRKKEATSQRNDQGSMQKEESSEREKRRDKEDKDRDGGKDRGKESLAEKRDAGAMQKGVRKDVLRPETSQSAREQRLSERKSAFMNRHAGGDGGNAQVLVVNSVGDNGICSRAITPKEPLRSAPAQHTPERWYPSSEKGGSWSRAGSFTSRPGTNCSGSHVSWNDSASASNTRNTERSMWDKLGEHDQRNRGPARPATSASSGTDSLFGTPHSWQRQQMPFQRHVLNVDMPPKTGSRHLVRAGGALLKSPWDL